VPPGDVQLYYQTLLIGRKELPYAPDRRMGVEMTLLRALAFHPREPLTVPDAPQASFAPAAPAAVLNSAQAVQAAHRSRNSSRSMMSLCPMPPARCWRPVANCSALRERTKQKE
jgi:DNA polymerase III gamma/tau subunit